MSEDQSNPPSVPPQPAALPAQPQSTGEGAKPMTPQQASRLAEVLGGLHPSVLVTVMTLIGALGGSGLVVALGGATTEQLEQVESDLDDVEERVSRMEYDLEGLKRQAEATKSIESDLNLLRNDFKHLSDKIDEIYRLRGGN